MPTMIREFYFQFHINSQCNLRCSHCYQDNYSSDKLSPEDLMKIAYKIIDACEKWKVDAHISLTGGEPFLSSSLWELLNIFDNCKSVKRLGILSNGTLIANDDVEKLRKYKKLHEVQISLDGSTPNTHDLIRGVGAFEKAIHGIRLLKKADIPVAIMFTLSSDNSRDVLNLLELAKKEYIDYATIERIVPCSNKQNNDKFISADELCKIYEIINNWAEQQPKEGHQLNIRRRRPLWALINSSINGFCPVGFSSLTIIDDGTVLPCRRLEIPLGNILTDGLYRIWYSSDILWKIRNKKLLKGKCNNCNLLANCGGCRAVTYALAGDFMDSDPQCWKD